MNGPVLVGFSSVPIKDTCSTFQTPAACPFVDTYGEFNTVHCNKTARTNVAGGSRSTEYLNSPKIHIF